MREYKSLDNWERKYMFTQANMFVHVYVYIYNVTLFHHTKEDIGKFCQSIEQIFKYKVYTNQLFRY